MRDLFTTDMSLLDVRRSLAKQHPMLDQDYTIETPEVSSFHDVVYDWLVARKSGLFACGRFRHGKTKAMEYTIDLLKEELPFMAFHRVEGKRMVGQSKAQFCAELLNQWEYPAALLKKGRAEFLLQNYLMTSCAHAGGKHCVLFVDEAQLWSVLQYRYLLEIWNALRIEGYIFSTVLVGQEGLVALKDLTAELDHGAVVARFFVRPYKFSGVRNIETLTKILRSFDTELFYPENSDWSFSRFFLQKAFDSGWRLEKEAPNYLAALEDTTEKNDKKMIKSSGFGTAWVIDGIHAFLLDNMKEDRCGFQGTPTLWIDSLMSGSTDKLPV